MNNILKFEGPEKKLEILFSGKVPSLRNNIDGRWDKVVRKSGAEIISSLTSDKVDAYLLSESSLFVWDDRILMITCGGTTLVDAIPEILKFTEKKDYMLFYECRNFNFPHLQPSDFAKDSEKIREYIKGDVVTLGDLKSNHVNIFCGGSTGFEREEDETFQILMDDIDPKSPDLFLNRNGNSAGSALKESGIPEIYEGMTLDSYLFTPYGFSVNGICDDNYFTIHVTPQEKFSFVSFETNVMEDSYAETLKKVVSVFRPDRFSVILTTNRSKAGSIGLNGLDYEKTFDEKSSLKGGYEVMFRNYRKRK